jgi:hypothetical protein
MQQLFNELRTRLASLLLGERAFDLLCGLHNGTVLALFIHEMAVAQDVEEFRLDISPAHFQHFFAEHLYSQIKVKAIHTGVLSVTYKRQKL